MNQPSTTFVVWTRDLEFTLSPSETPAAKKESVTFKGRCTACWGGLGLRGQGEDSVPSQIKCRVCKRTLAGAAAADEYQRVMAEAINNNWRASLGCPPTCERGRFVCKRFPNLPRLTEDAVRERIASKGRREHSTGMLTRNEFPLGEAAYLYVQARLLAAAVSDMYASHDEAVVAFDKATTEDPKADGCGSSSSAAQGASASGTARAT